MPYFSVDLSAVPMKQREQICESIRRFAWESFPQYSADGLVSVEFLWNRRDDAVSVCRIPAECPCVKLGD